MFPISSKVTFSVLFVLFKAEITVSKLTLHLMGKMFNIRVGKIKFGIWRGTSLFYFATWKLWAALAVSVQWTIYHVRTEVRQSLLSFSICWNFQKYPCTSDRERTGRLVKFVDLCRKWINKVKPGIYWEEILLLLRWKFDAKISIGKKLGFCSSKAEVPVLFLILYSFVIYTTERLMF